MFGIGADGRGCVDAVIPRHREVHQDEVRPVFERKVARFAAVSGNANAMPAKLDQPPQRVANIGPMLCN